jgi:spore coat polysaccharide biosynthesis protein SpsF
MASLKTLAIIQARVNSKRLKRKVLLPINGRPSIEWVINRTKACSLIDDVVLATSNSSDNDPLEILATENGWNLFRGDENDVLSRYSEIVVQEQPDIVVRVCADNFLLDPVVLAETIKSLIKKRLVICNPFLQNTYPFGVGAEVATAATVLRIDEETKNLTEKKYREHIFIWAYEHPENYQFDTLIAPENLVCPELSVSVDNWDDFELVRGLYSLFRERELDVSTQIMINAWRQYGIDYLRQLGRNDDGH